MQQRTLTSTLFIYISLSCTNIYITEESWVEDSTIGNYIESSDDESNSNSVTIGTVVEDIVEVPSKGNAIVSTTQVHNEPKHQKLFNAKNINTVQDVQGMFGPVCQVIESDDENDYYMDKDSIAYVAKDVEKIDCLNFEDSYVSSDEDE